MRLKTLFVSALTGSQKAIDAFIECCINHPLSRSQQKILHQRAIESIKGSSNDSNAFMLLGVLYSRAQPQAVRYAKAIVYYDHAIVLGNPYAMTERARMYYQGEGGRVDSAEAIALFDCAIKLGCVRAMYNRAVMHHFGKGVPVNFPEAIELYEQAITLGCVRAMYNRAVMHHFGKGSPVNFPEAIKLYGQVLQQSQQQQSHHEKSLRQLVRLANDNQESAAFHLFLYYLSGQKQARDLTEAMRWFTKDITKNLVLLYEKIIEQNDHPNTAPELSTRLWEFVEQIKKTTDLTTNLKIHYLEMQWLLRGDLDINAIAACLNRLQCGLDQVDGHWPVKVIALESIGQLGAVARAHLVPNASEQDTTLWDTLLTQFQLKHKCRWLDWIKFPIQLTGVTRSARYVKAMLNRQCGNSLTTVLDLIHFTQQKRLTAKRMEALLGNAGPAIATIVDVLYGLSAMRLLPMAACTEALIPKGDSELNAFRDTFEHKKRPIPILNFIQTNKLPISQLNFDGWPIGETHFTRQFWIQTVVARMRQIPTLHTFSLKNVGLTKEEFRGLCRMLAPKAAPSEWIDEVLALEEASWERTDEMLAPEEALELTEVAFTVLIGEMNHALVPQELTITPIVAAVITQAHRCGFLSRTFLEHVEKYTRQVRYETEPLLRVSRLLVTLADRGLATASTANFIVNDVENITSLAAVINIAAGHFLSSWFMRQLKYYVDRDACHALAVIADQFGVINIGPGWESCISLDSRDYKMLCAYPYAAKNFSQWFGYSELHELFTPGELKAEADRIAWGVQLVHDFGLEVEWLQKLKLSTPDDAMRLYFYLSKVSFYQPRVVFNEELVKALAGINKTPEDGQSSLFDDILSSIQKRIRKNQKYWQDFFKKNAKKPATSTQEADTCSMGYLDFRCNPQGVEWLIRYGATQQSARFDTLDITDADLTADQLNRLMPYLSRFRRLLMTGNPKIVTPWPLIQKNIITKNIITMPWFLLEDTIATLGFFILERPLLKKLADVIMTASSLRVLELDALSQQGVEGLIQALNKRQEPLSIRISGCAKTDKDFNLLYGTLTLRQATRAWLLGETVPLHQHTPAMRTIQSVIQSFLALNGEADLEKQQLVTGTFNEKSSNAKTVEESPLEKTSLPEALPVFRRVLEVIVEAFGPHEADSNADKSLENKKKQAKAQSATPLSTVALYYERAVVLKEALAETELLFPADTVTQLPYKKQLECWEKLLQALVNFTVVALPSDDELQEQIKKEKERIKTQLKPDGAIQIHGRSPAWLIDVLQQSLVLTHVYTAKLASEVITPANAKYFSAEEVSAFKAPLENFYTGVQLVSSPYVNNDFINELDTVYKVHNFVMKVLKSGLAAIPLGHLVCTSLQELTQLNFFKDKEKTISAGLNAAWGVGVNYGVDYLVKRGLSCLRDKAGINVINTMNALKIGRRIFQNNVLAKQLINATFRYFVSSHSALLETLSAADRIELFSELSQHLVEQLGIGAFEPDRGITQTEMVAAFVNKALAQMVYAPIKQRVPHVEKLRSAWLVCNKYQKGENGEAVGKPEKFYFQWSEVSTDQPDMIGRKTYKFSVAQSDETWIAYGARHATAYETDWLNILDERSAIRVTVPENEVSCHDAASNHENQNKPSTAERAGPSSDRADGCTEQLKFPSTLAFGKDKEELIALYRGSDKKIDQDIKDLPYPNKAGSITYISQPMVQEQIEELQHYVFKAIPCSMKSKEGRLTELGEDVQELQEGVQELKGKGQNTDDRLGFIEEEFHLERNDKDLKIRQLFEKVAALDIDKAGKKDLQEMLEGLQEDFDTLEEKVGGLESIFHKYKEKTAQKIGNLEQNCGVAP